MHYNRGGNREPDGRKLEYDTPVFCHGKATSLPSVLIRISANSASLRLVLLLIPLPSLPSAPRRSPPPASPHCSLPSLPAIPRALPSSRSLPPHFEGLPRSSPPLPPAQTPHHSPALPAPAPQTPSSSATPPDRSTQTATKIPSTSYIGSAVPSLLSAQPS